MHSAGAPTRRLRPARLDDLDELVRVNLAAFRAGNAPALSQEAAAQLSIDAARAQWRQFLEHQPVGATVTVAERAGHAGEAEQSDHALAVVVGSAAGQEHDRGPQHREPGHRQCAERHALAQRGLLGDQRDHRAQQLGVAQPLGGRNHRQPAMQREGEREHRPRGEGEDQPPATECGDQPAEGAGGQDSDQQAAHDRPHDLAALLRAGERRGERDDDHGDDRQRAEGDQRRGEERGTMAQRRTPRPRRRRRATRG